jgi:hypothetical protein
MDPSTFMHPMQQLWPVTITRAGAKEVCSRQMRLQNGPLPSGGLTP